MAEEFPTEIILISAEFYTENIYLMYINESCDQGDGCSTSGPLARPASARQRSLCSGALIVGSMGSAVAAIAPCSAAAASVIVIVAVAAVAAVAAAVAGLMRVARSEARCRKSRSLPPPPSLPWVLKVEGYRKYRSLGTSPRLTFQARLLHHQEDVNTDRYV